MNKKTVKLFIAQSLALTMLFAVSASACKPTDNGDNGSDGYVVTMNYNYVPGSGETAARPYNKMLDEGEALATPATPKREGYTFSKWTTEKDGGSEVSFPFTPSADTTIYAQWVVRVCNVTYDWNFEGAPKGTVINKNYNTVLEKTEEPDGTSVSREDYDFVYWMNKPADGKQVEYPVTVKDDIIYYANWVEKGTKLFTLNFDANYEGAEAIDPITNIIEGQSIDLFDKSLKRTGYTFEGWATTANAGKDDVVSVNYTPTESITLYAVWTRQTFKVNFDYNDFVHGTFDTLDIGGGDNLVAPENNPQRSGYTFIGWYTVASGGSLVDFENTKVSRATTYYAHWESNPVTVTNGIFDAEFVYINPLEEFPGYSGEVNGYNIIGVGSGEQNASTQHEGGASGLGYYVTYLYKKDATLEFVIESSEAVSGVTLKASLAIENQAQMIFTPDGETGYQFIVNGQSVDYGSIVFDNFENVGESLYACAFREFTIGNISLVKGTNIIKLVTNNSFPGMGGTMKAAAPMVDYIKLENTGSATLTWKPEYDNLRKLG